MNPRARLGSRQGRDVNVPPRSGVGRRGRRRAGRRRRPDQLIPRPARSVATHRHQAERRQARKERRRLLLPPARVHHRLLILLFWIVCAIGGDRITPYDPDQRLRPAEPAARRRALLRHRPARARRAVAGHGRRARRAHRRAHRGHRSSVAFGSLFGLLMGYFRGWLDDVLSRIIEALLSIPVMLMALLIIDVLGSSRRGHLHRRPRSSRRSSPAPSAPQCWPRPSSTTSPRPSCGASPGSSS